MNSGIKKQMKDSPIFKKGGITREQLEQTVDYIFKNNSNKIKLDNTLHITDNKDYLYFKYNTFTTGLEGFKNIYKAGLGFDIQDVYYNNVLLNEEQRKQIFNQLFRTEEK